MEHFPTLEELRTTPREQVLVRLKGLPRAEATVNTLFAEGVIEEEIQNATAYVKETRERRVEIITPLDDGYPPRLNNLDAAHRPTSLFLFGDPSLLKTSTVSFFAEEPLPQPALEAASRLAMNLSRHAVTAIIGCASGFDTTLLKQAAGIRAPSIAVVPAGLSKLDTSLRPAAAALARSGGCLLSPFEMAHGPFDHDMKEAQRVQAALSAAVVALNAPPDSTTTHIIEWARSREIPIFRFTSNVQENIDTETILDSLKQ